ncbi:MAG: lysophospholipid acyltransferase family protein [Coraliomargarita sp.]
MAVKVGANTGKAKQLKWHQLLLLRLCALLMGLWTRTLRYGWGQDVQEIIDAEHPPSIVILWHNRLFAAPELFRRQFRERRLAALISASGDGAWLAAFIQSLGMSSVRGSRYNRGAQAVRELIEALNRGSDLAVTPDGSRGPVYDMKAGAVSVALKTGAPIVLLSLNFNGAWRLNSWDRFFIPYPFSKIEVRMDRIANPSELETEDPDEAAAILKRRMDAITEDSEWLG